MLPSSQPTHGALLLTIIVAIAVGVSASHVNAQGGLPCDNPRLPTEAEVAAGAPQGVKGCPDDFKTIAPDEGAAKQYLRSILCPPDGDNYGGYGPDGTIQRLDVKFAICAARFLNAAQQNGISVCVREGARTVAKQNEYVRRGVLACKKGAACEHPRGIAIDVNVNPNPESCASYQRLHQSAPSFGLVFYLGCRDKYHFVPQKGGCTAGGIVPPDADLPPAYYDHPQYYTPGAAAPSSPLTNALRDTIAPPQQEQMCTLPDGLQVPCSSIANRGGAPAGAAGGPSGGPVPPQQSLPPSGQPFSDDQTPLQSPPSSGQPLSYAQEPSLSQTPSENLLSPASPASDLLRRSTADVTPRIPTSSPQSAIEQIGEIAYPEQFLEESNVSDALILAVSGSDAYSLEGEQENPNGASTSPADAERVAGSQVAPPGLEQTFTSVDLSRTPVQLYPPQELSALQRTLAAMRDTLLRILAYLRPFGRPAPQGSAYNEFGERVE